MNDCIFCKIIKGDIPSKKYYEDELMIVIADIDPKAKLHYLAIPKKHYKLLSEMSADDAVDLGKCMKKISEIAPTLGLENGYRLIINQGDDAIQTVPHLHIHILGGQKLVLRDFRTDV
ncbi:MAG: histidine triad nucleotide-binding protein [Clostridiales bacterium]|nr:histidine triad nucleotide-binding protein [Clostridiales bacterium]